MRAECRLVRDQVFAIFFGAGWHFDGLSRPFLFQPPARPIRRGRSRFGVSDHVHAGLEKKGEKKAIRLYIALTLTSRYHYISVFAGSKRGNRPRPRSRIFRAPRQGELPLNYRIMIPFCCLSRWRSRRWNFKAHGASVCLLGVASLTRIVIGACAGCAPRPSYRP